MKWITAYLFAVAVFVVQAATETHAQTWAVYKPDGIGYSIEMPGEWATSVMDIPSRLGPLKGYYADVNLGAEDYGTMYIVYPADKLAGKSVTPLLDGARDGAVSNVNGTLRSEERVIVSNLPARQIIVDAPEKLVLVMRFFLKDNVLIEGVVVGHAGVEFEPNTKRFLESMKTISMQYGLSVPQSPIPNALELTGQPTRACARVSVTV